MRHPVLSASLAAVLVLQGCGGGGGGASSADNGNPNEGGTETVPEVSGLSGDADNQDRLFYTSAEGLFAVHPASPEEPERVDPDVALDGSAPYFVHPIHEAVIGGGLAEYRVDRVLYFTAEDYARGEFRSASTDPAPQQVTPVRVSSEDSALAAQGTRFFQYDVETPGDSAYAYPYSSDTGWRYFRIGDSASTDPIQFASNLQIVTTAWDPAARAPGGWLAIDDNDNETLKLVDMDGAIVGAPTNAGSPVSDVYYVNPLGPELGDGSQYLVLTFVADDQAAESGEVWRYQRGDAAGEPGTLEPLMSEGERLELPPALMGPGAQLPNQQRLVVRDDELYFFVQEGLLGTGAATLYRVYPEGWESILREDEGFGLGTALASAGDYLVWVMNETVETLHVPTGRREALDDRGGAQGYDVSDLDIPLQGSRDGWVFYNLTLFDIGRMQAVPLAVASQADGSDRVEIRDARWVGASTSGRAAATGSLISALELSEVFLVRGGTRLAAVSASAPGVGMVPLGQLPASTEEVAFAGLAPGPHRLLQISHGDRYEVAYVSTREQNSLTQLMDAPQESNLNRPVSGF